MEQRYLLGIDGGGTKTAFELTDLAGLAVATHTDRGTSYRQYGFDKVLATLVKGRDSCLARVGAPSQSIAAIGIGLPFYEEFPENDKVITELIREVFSPAKVLIVNDTEVAWAGSLGCRPGINVVAGTGSVSFGRNECGGKARCGGWSIVFGDEGSSYWAGIKLMELFMKEADGRKPRGALYELVREKFSILDDIEFIALMHEEYLPHRDKVAALQMLLEQAARQGDAEAVGIYLAAADELALLVAGTRDRLGFTKDFAVSYSGGMFKAGDLILPTFTNHLQALGGHLTPPLYTPVHGAVLLALDSIDQKEVLDNGTS